ncbi:MAG: hypothetical protein U5R49_08075 [Deltaproteobacteria bacterium]|nr:hypothetical protein [Deltaproteobacteria bacterium]
MVSKKRRKKKKKRKSAKSVNPETRVSKPATVSGDSEASGADFDAVAAEIRHLLIKGNSKKGLARAKEVYKALGDERAKALLVEAYMSRIQGLVKKQYLQEAQTLFDLVRSRHGFPETFEIEMEATLSALNGDMKRLLKPLADPQTLPPARQAAIFKAIRDDVWDLKSIADCEALSKDHPLRKEASALHEAFCAVTREENPGQGCSLSGISRKSPLAPWKMLIRGIEAFYTFEDQLCARCLDAVDSGSAPGRVVPVLRAIISGETENGPDRSTSAFMEQVLGGETQLLNALSRLDEVMGNYAPVRTVFAAIKGAVGVCEAVRPGLLKKLKQHIYVRCRMMEFPHGNVEKAMGGPPLKNAYFWRLYARANEVTGEPLWACALWDQFSIHAIHEGVLSSNGPEPAALYHHMALLLGQMDDGERSWQMREFKALFPSFDADYRGQPEFIRDAFQHAERPSEEPFYFLSPAKLYELACKVDPVSENYLMWFSWARKTAGSWKEIDPVAISWHEAIPGDIRPLMYLTRSTEKRHALKKALGYLNKAEAVDRLSPEVKQARKRLMVSIAIRHLKQKKTHLAQKDFQEMEGLPQFSAGDGRAFLSALKCVSALIHEQTDSLESHYSRALRMQAGPIAAHMVLSGLFNVCGMGQKGDRFLSRKNEKPSTDEAAATAVAGACLLFREMGMDLPEFHPYAAPTERYLRKTPVLMDPAAIRAIAETALVQGEHPLAYEAAGAGLKKRDSGTARFLLLRARSLPPWAFRRRDDCIDAALAMARRERDMTLIDEAMDFKRHRRGRVPFYGGFDAFDGDEALDLKDVEDIITQELECEAYPHEPSVSAGGGFPRFEDDEDDDDDDEWDDGWDDDEGDGTMRRNGKALRMNVSLKPWLKCW